MFIIVLYNGYYMILLTQHNLFYFILFLYNYSTSLLPPKFYYGSLPFLHLITGSENAQRTS